MNVQQPQATYQQQPGLVDMSYNVSFSVIDNYIRLGT